MSKRLKSDQDGWNKNVDLCMDVMTFLRNDRITQLSKDYAGVLTRDGEDHYTFVETLPMTEGKRNPHVFDGKYITITRRDDGGYRPNFKPLKIGGDFTVDGYAIGVMGELRQALTGLVKNSQHD